MKGYLVHIQNKENLVGRFYSKEEIEHTIGISTCFRKFLGKWSIIYMMKKMLTIIQ